MNTYEYGQLNARYKELLNSVVKDVDVAELKSISDRMKEIESSKPRMVLPDSGIYTTFCEEMKKRRNNPNNL